MKSILKKFYTAILCGAMLLGVCLACACSKSGGGSKEGGKTERAFLSLKDYNEVKSGLSGTGALSGAAKEKATEELIVGQTYCFVYAFELKDTAPSMSSKRDLDSYVNFSLKTWGGIYFGTDAVDFVGFDYDDGIKASFNSNPETLNCTMVLEKKNEWYYEEGLYHHLKSFVCIQFVPKYAGTIYVESNIYGEWYKKAEDNKQWVSASVFENSAAAQSGAKCNINSLSCGLVSGDVYNKGLLKEDTDLAAISEMKIGENYVVVDFDIEAVKSDGTDEVYCGIYIHNGAWEDARLEDANTSKTKQTRVRGGTVFDFAYKVPASGSRKIRTVMSFTALDVCLVDIDFYMFGDGVSIGGNTFTGEHFAEESVAALTYEIDEETQICRVTGMEGENENVIIPDRYQGYPVLEVARNAFKGRNIKALAIGNYVQKVGAYAFENCTQLSSVLVGSRVGNFEGNVFKNCNSLTKISLPASLYHSCGDFVGCDNLESITFENPYGWKVASSQLKDEIYLGDAYIAAELFTKTYNFLDWWNSGVLYGDDSVDK